MKWSAALRVLIAGAALALPASLKADGGTLRRIQRAGDVEVSVFTDPTPLRIGPIDVSILLQNAGTGAVTKEGRLTVRCRPADHGEWLEAEEATQAAATNKLYRAARLELATAGRWLFEITLEQPGEPVRVEFAADVYGPRPRWQELLPWISWPVLVILLYVLHLVLEVRRGK